MKEIIEQKICLARHILSEDIKEGLNFYSNDEEYIQVGAWCYSEGKELLAHVHHEVERVVKRTYEVLYVIEGSIEADIYDLPGNKKETWIIQQGEILILLECGHGYRILKDGTKVLEVKNGPYLGAEIDRKRL